MDEAGGEFFDSLPDTVPIYRGCSKERVRGISWTTDRTVAKSFASGHRGVAVPNASLAHAIIPKGAVFCVFTDRQESEVLIDPDRLQKVETYSYANPSET